MNTIANVPAAPRAGQRANGSSHGDGDGAEFQFALGLAAASQTRAPEPLASSSANEPRPDDDRAVVNDEESGTNGTSGEAAEVERDADDARASGADSRTPTSHEMRHEPRAREAAETPGTAQNAASPASAAATSARPTSEAAGATPSALRIALAPVADPRAATAELSVVDANLSSTQPSPAPEGAHVRLVSTKLAAPQAPVVAKAVPAAAGRAQLQGLAAMARTSVAEASPAPAVTSGKVTTEVVASAAPPQQAPAESELEHASPARAVFAAPRVVAPSVTPASTNVESLVTDAAPLAKPAETLVTGAAPAVAAAAKAPTRTLRGDVTPAHADESASAEAAAPRTSTPRPVIVEAAVPSARTQGRAGEQRNGAGGEQAPDREGAAREFLKPTAPVAEPTTNAAPAPTANAAPGASAAPSTSVSLRTESQAATLVQGTDATPDPRLEPMRRIADQVTLQFQGEGGLEGRLRISVRGDSVRASILSSHDGTLQRAGGEMGALKRALADQGFTDAKVSVQDTRALTTSGAGASREQSQSGTDRRQGEPREKHPQGREPRQDGGSSNRGRRESRDERRNA